MSPRHLPNGEVDDSGPNTGTGRDLIPPLRWVSHSWTEDEETWTISADEHEVDVRHRDGSLPGYALPLPVRNEMLRLSMIMEAARGYEISREPEDFERLQSLLHEYEERFQPQEVADAE